MKWPCTVSQEDIFPNGQHHLSSIMQSTHCLIHIQCKYGIILNLTNNLYDFFSFFFEKAIVERRSANVTVSEQMVFVLWIRNWISTFCFCEFSLKSNCQTCSSFTLSTSFVLYCVLLYPLCECGLYHGYCRVFTVSTFVLFGFITVNFFTSLMPHV